YSPASFKVGRVVPTAPQEVVQLRTFRAPSNPRGAVGTPRPTDDRAGQHGRQPAVFSPSTAPCWADGSSASHIPRRGSREPRQLMNDHFPQPIIRSIWID